MPHLAGAYTTREGSGFPGEEGVEVVERLEAHGVAGLDRGAAQMRQQEGVGQRRGSPGGSSARRRTRRGRPPPAARSSARRSAPRRRPAAPRAVFTTMAPSGSSAMRSALTNSCVAGVDRRVDRQEVAVRQHRLGVGVEDRALLEVGRQAACGCCSGSACRRRARARRPPGRCGPCRGCRAACRSRARPELGRGPAAPSWRRAACARPRRRAARRPAGSSRAMSAVASVSTSGVLLTTMPRALQAARSICS